MATQYDEFGDRDGNPRPIWAHEHEVRPCTVEDLFAISGERGEPEQAFLDDCTAYLSAFAAPVRKAGGEMLCLHCGEALTGMLASLLGRGGFTWGLVHGEGHCANCHWPARAYHFAKDAEGKELFTLRSFVLQYLPDFEAEARAKAASEQLSSDQSQAA